MASSRVQALEEENAKLVAEMASMKKKIMVHLRKQQAELQAKVQEAEARASAAEAALASQTSGSVDDEISKLKAALEMEKQRSGQLEERAFEEKEKLESQICECKFLNLRLLQFFYY
ncbi:hypothetical protein SUGI_0980400 [Cryptomeria japonica]|nr:hypothetical protein SUGI_0980400 [Cryptomeria japonica]